MRARALSGLALVAGISGCLSWAAAAQPAVMEGGAHPAVSPDGKRIAFLSNRDGTQDLYVISADGKGEVRLTRTPEEEVNPSWSADGRHLIFSTGTGEKSEIFSIDPSGENRHPVGSVPGRSAVVSPDGVRTLYSVGSWTAVRLIVSGLDGSSPRPLTDGTSVVWNAQWAPDGRSIAFTARDAAGNLNVSVMHADGTERRQVTHIDPAEGNAQVPAWSPDGRHLAVQVNHGKTAHLWIVDIASGGAKKLGQHAEEYLDEVPSWFPDGKSLAFQSNRSGRMEIWRMNDDGSGARQVTGTKAKPRPNGSLR